MPLTRQQQRQIMLDDAKRRNARDAQEIANWMTAHGYAGKRTDPGCDDYHVSRQITGQPSDHNRVTRASRNSWDRGMARTTTVGVAEPTDTVPTMFVYIDGVRTKRIIERTRSNRSKRTRPTVVAAQSDCAAMAATIGYIGNVE